LEGKEDREGRRRKGKLTSRATVDPFDDFRDRFTLFCKFCLGSPSASPPTTNRSTSIEPLLVCRNTFRRVASVSSAARGGSMGAGILRRGSIT
jgi:hypothetical protein